MRSDDTQSTDCGTHVCSLPTELTECSIAPRTEIRRLHETIGCFLDPDIATFARRFRRDLHPICELTDWWQMERAWELFHERFTNGNYLNPEMERRLITALLALSLGMSLPQDRQGWAEAVADCYRDARGGNDRP